MVCYQIACIDITFFLGYADGCVNVGVRGDQDSGDAHVDREWWCPCVRLNTSVHVYAGLHMLSMWTVKCLCPCPLERIHV